MEGGGTSLTAQDLGLIIALLRTGLGWSQAQLARESGVPASAISQYEAGKKLPELASLTRLLDSMAFGFSDIDKARLFLLSLRLNRDAGGKRQGTAAPQEELSDLLSEQIASATSEVGTAVSRLTEALALLIRERPCASRRSKDDGRQGRTKLPSCDDRRGAVALWKRLQKYPPALQEILVKESQDFQCWALCELVCIESEKQAANDAATAIQLSSLAVRIADLAPGEETWRCKLRSFAAAFLGNALRVQGDLTGADESFRRSEEFRKAGEACTIGLLEESRVLDLKASFRRSQRRFRDSLELLESALQADRQGSLRGQLLIKRAKTLEEMGDLEAALAALKQAEEAIDPQADRKLFANLKHNRTDYLSKLGRFAEAEALLPEVKALYLPQGNELDSLRLRWVEARIENGMGRSERAIEILTQVRGEFASRRMAYDTALVSLELATMFAREGLTEQVKTLARHMAPFFQVQGIHREALAALALFRQAAEEEWLTAELGCGLFEFLLRARHDPELRFEAPERGRPKARRGRPAPREG